MIQLTYSMVMSKKPIFRGELLCQNCCQPGHCEPSLFWHRFVCHFVFFTFLCVNFLTKELRGFILKPFGSVSQSLLVQQSRIFFYLYISEQIIVEGHKQKSVGFKMSVFFLFLLKNILPIYKVFESFFVKIYL